MKPKNNHTKRLRREFMRKRIRWNNFLWLFSRTIARRVGYQDIARRCLYVEPMSEGALAEVYHDE